MTTDTAHSGVREIDTGELPIGTREDGTASGTVKDLPATAHHRSVRHEAGGLRRFQQGELKVLDGYRRHMGATPSRGHHQSERDRLRCPRLALGGDGRSRCGPTPNAPLAGSRHLSLAHRRPGGSAVRLRTTRATRPPRTSISPEILNGPAANGPTGEGTRCHRGQQQPRDHRQRHRHGGTLFYIHFGLPTHFKNVFEGHRVVSNGTTSGQTSTTWAPRTWRLGLDVSKASYWPSFMINWLHNKYGDFWAVESIPDQPPLPVNRTASVLQWGVIVEKPRAHDATIREAGRRSPRASGLPAGRGDLKYKTRIDNPVGGGGRRRHQMRRWYQQFCRREPTWTAGDDRPLEPRGQTPLRVVEKWERRGSGESPEPGHKPALNRRNSSSRVTTPPEEAGTRDIVLVDRFAPVDGAPARWPRRL